ncbi:hypothetical protein ACSS6W_000672 [Trichoderma asperelloides]
MPQLCKSSGKRLRKSSPQASYNRLLSFNQSQTRIPNARSHMPSTAHRGTLAVMPFPGHDSSLIGHGLY